MFGPYVYRVESVDRVIDGDSYELTLDLGFNARLEVRVRLLGADTFEMRGGTEETKALAHVGREFAEDWFREHEREILCRTVAVDSFGRWLAELRSDESSLADELVEAGLTTGRYEE